VAPVDNADHNVLICEFQCNANTVSCNKERLCYNRADYDGMRKFVKQKLLKLTQPRQQPHCGSIIMA